MVSLGENDRICAEEQVQASSAQVSAWNSKTLAKSRSHPKMNWKRGSINRQQRLIW